MRSLKLFILILVPLFALLSVVSAERVIVIMEDTQQIKQAEDLQTLKMFVLEYQQDIMETIKEFEKQGKVKDVKQLWIVNAIAMDASPDVIEELKKRKDVKKIIPDYKVELLSSNKITRLFNIFNFSQGIKLVQSEGEIAWNVKWIEADKVWKIGINGSGVNVSVVDSGIAPHPDLEDKIVAWRDFVNNITTPYDDNGHGTHVAGTIAGTGKLGIKTGVAPGANLIGVKVFDQYGCSNISTVLAGFQWSVEHGADIISFSGGMLPMDIIGNSSHVYLNSTNEHTIYVNSSYYEEAFKPAFIIAYVFSPDLANLSISLVAPNKSVVHGDRLDWIQIDPETEWLYKYMEDKPLQSGNWTLRIKSLKCNHNHVWYSGKGGNLNNILVCELDLTNVTNATLRFWTMYDIGEGDFGYVEVVYNNTPTTLANFTGYAKPHIEEIDLSYFAGKKIKLVFRYTTDDFITYSGWYIDNIEIPEIGFYDDVENGTGVWDANGWSIINESIPYRYMLIVVYPSDGTSSLDEAVNRIVENGIVVVVAAGNDGELGLRTISSPGSASKAITVGATGYMNDSIARFSSRGPVGWNENETIKPDIVAPGVGVISTYYDVYNDQYRYEHMSGTSMATPHVSGVVALMLQANPSLTPEEIKQILKNTALDLGKLGEDNIYGAGRVNAFAAVRAVLNVTHLYVPDDYKTIQEAIKNARDGDVIIVRDGIYYENLVINKRIILKSENGSANCIIDGNNASDVIVINADGVTIEGFTIKNSSNRSAGIKVNSSNNIIANNSIENNYDGIYLKCSSNNVIINNTIISNRNGGIFLYNSSNNVIVNNSIANNTRFGIIIWLSSYNNIIVNNTIFNNSKGVFLPDLSNNNIITENTIKNNTYGILLDNSSNNVIVNNSIANNDKGILLWLSSNNIIVNNDILYNKWGILLDNSNNNTIVNNSIVLNNDEGISLYNYSSNNIIVNNTITFNGDKGIYLNNSNKNIIIQNTIANNSWGIFLAFSSNNIIYFNNFINNTNNNSGVYFSTSLWNSTEKITYIYNSTQYTRYLGNYWDDYQGSDRDGDGIGDTPYQIDSNNSDYHPLMMPFENYVIVKAPDIEVNPKVIDFGNVTVNDTKTKIIVITNKGNADLNITNISTQYPAPPAEIGLKNIPKLPLILKPNESYNLTAFFSPSKEGIFFNNVTIESNDPDEPIITIPLMGRAIPNLPPNVTIEVPKLVYIYDDISTSVQIKIAVYDLNGDSINRFKVWMVYPNNTIVKIEERLNIKSSSFNYSTNISISEPGIYVVLVLAEDQHGNVNCKSKSFEVRINRTIPQIEIDVEQLVELTYYEPKSVNITINVKDIDNITRFNVTVWNLTDGIVIVKKSYRTNNVTLQINISKPADYLVYVEAEDEAGNIGKASKIFTAIRKVDITKQEVTTVNNTVKVTEKLWIQFNVKANVTVNLTLEESTNATTFVETVPNKISVTKCYNISINISDIENVTAVKVTINGSSPVIWVYKQDKGWKNVTNIVTIDNGSLTINLTKVGLEVFGYDTNNISEFYADPVIATGESDDIPPILNLTADNTTVTIGDVITFTLTSNEPLQNATIIVCYDNGTEFFRDSMTMINETKFEYQWITNATGNFTVYAEAYDEAGNVNESNRLNITVHMEQPELKPDLTITKIDTDKTELLVGQVCEISVTVENIGNQVAENFSVSLYADDSEIDSESIRRLDPGDTVTLKFTWKPSSAGTYNVYAIVDPDGRVDELDESNNVSSTITVEVQQITRVLIGGGGGGYVALPTPTPTPVVTPTPIVTPTPVITPMPTPTPVITPTPTPTPTPKPWWKIPGFELIYAIIALLALAHILRKRQKL